MKFQVQLLFWMEVKKVFWHWLHLSAAAWAFVHGDGKNIKHTWFLADADT